MAKRSKPKEFIPPCKHPKLPICEHFGKDGGMGCYFTFKGLVDQCNMPVRVYLDGFDDNARLPTYRRFIGELAANWWSKPRHASRKNDSLVAEWLKWIKEGPSDEHPPIRDDDSANWVKVSERVPELNRLVYTRDGNGNVGAYTRVCLYGPPERIVWTSLISTDNNDIAEWLDGGMRCCMKQ